MKVVKNKVSPPFKEVEFDILYGEGISREGDILDLASNEGIIEKSGTWYTYKGERIGQGRENARQYLKEHPEMMDKARAEVLAKHNLAKKAAGADRAAEAPATDAKQALAAGKEAMKHAQTTATKAAPATVKGKEK